MYFQALQMNFSKNLTLQWLGKKLSMLLSLCTLTYRWKPYLKRWVILSDFHSHCIWHLVAVIFYCYQRVIDETGLVRQVPRRCQNQEPIANQWERKIYCLFGKTVRQCLEELNTHFPYDLASPVLDIYPREMKTYLHTKTCVQVFIVALLMTA